ncbi:hypothetical protein E2C01_018311 [Portunus trituberculatus]|uniref:Uncharacterized protein n=1 Tax=Portunus trituberculatus TaxID=210409 RepID=A0A5B7DVS8_PORTR|nr:hypothetical protein [Portunus trituberculatus]
MSGSLYRDMGVYMVNSTHCNNKETYQLKTEHLRAVLTGYEDDGWQGDPSVQAIHSMVEQCYFTTALCSYRSNSPTPKNRGATKMAFPGVRHCSRMGSMQALKLAHAACHSEPHHLPAKSKGEEEKQGMRMKRSMKTVNLASNKPGLRNGQRRQLHKDFHNLGRPSHIKRPFYK